VHFSCPFVILSVCLSCIGSYSKHKSHRKNKICVSVFQGSSDQYANFYLEKSKVMAAQCRGRVRLVRRMAADYVSTEMTLLLFSVIK